LSDRTQRVKINGKLSQPQQVKIGIPQGTVLGPILFLLYINDLYSVCSEGDIVSYADDTAIIYSASSWQEAKLGAERCLVRVKSWLDYNLLTLNAGKTKFIAFSIQSNKQPTFSSLNLTENDKIDKVSQIKYLGLMLDQHLRWDIHANYISKKIRKTIFIFYTLRNIISKRMLTIVYNSLIESILRYGIIVWGGILPGNLYNLQIAQNYLLKVMLGLDRFFPTADLYSTHKILDIKQLYIHTILCWVHRNINKQNTVSHSYQTRGNMRNDLVRDKYDKNICQRQPQFHGPKYYNLLPNGIKKIKSIKLFSKSVKEYIFENSSTFN